MPEHMIKPDKKFTWTNKKLEVAKTIATGLYSQRDIAKEFNITEVTVSRWKQHPEFLAKIDELTLSHELATKAGLLREAYKGLDIKRDRIEFDKTTHLDYLKAIADVQGINKQTTILNNNGVMIKLQMIDCSTRED